MYHVTPPSTYGWLAGILMLKASSHASTLDLSLSSRFQLPGRIRSILFFTERACVDTCIATAVVEPLACGEQSLHVWWLVELPTWLNKSRSPSTCNQSTRGVVSLFQVVCCISLALRL